MKYSGNIRPPQSKLLRTLAVRLLQSAMEVLRNDYLQHMHGHNNDHFSILGLNLELVNGKHFFRCQHLGSD
ncbi:hypothetical protein COOONC_01530 [Cooperia oncophora]